MDAVGALFVQRSVAGLVPPPPGAVERAWLRAYSAVTRVLGLRQLAGAWYGAVPRSSTPCCTCGFRTSIARRVRQGLTSVHAAHYNITSGEVAFYDEASGKFVALSSDGRDAAQAPGQCSCRPQLNGVIASRAAAWRSTIRHWITSSASPPRNDAMIFDSSSSHPAPKIYGVQIKVAFPNVSEREIEEAIAWAQR